METEDGDEDSTGGRGDRRAGRECGAGAGNGLNTMLYDKAFGMDLVSIAGESNKFEGTIDKAKVTGKLHRTGPGTSDKTTYDVSVTFTAPIQRAK